MTATLVRLLRMLKYLLFAFYAELGLRRIGSHLDCSMALLFPGNNSNAELLNLDSIIDVSQRLRFDHQAWQEYSSARAQRLSVEG